MENIFVQSFDGLLVKFAKTLNATFIIRGMRAVSDFEFEFKLALMNRDLEPDIETIFFCTSVKNMFISSTLVKEVAYLGGDISSHVPPEILEDIKNKIKIDKINHCCPMD